MRNFISPIISERKPDFLKTEYRRFALFIDNFYSFLEEQGNPLEVLENFSESCEANTETPIYIDKILYDCGFDINKPLSISKKELILHLRDFYLSRGSEASFKFLYKLLYNCDVSVDYPRKKLLIPSQATYSGRYFVYTTTSNIGSDKFNKIMGLVDSYDLVLNGVSSKAQCSIESISIIHSLDLAYLRIQVDAPYYQFQKGEAVRITSQSTHESIVETFVDTVDIEITDPGKGYRIGDKITMSGTNVIGSARVRTLREGMVSDIEIVSGGTGYVVGDQILTTQRSKGHSFSAYVSQVDTSQNYLSIPNHAGFNLTTGDFTIEDWIFLSPSITDSIICSTKHPTESKGWAFKVNGYRKLSFQIFGNSTQTFTSTRTVPNNKWVHIAASREGNTIKLFVDGVLSSSNSVQSGIASSEDLRIGLSTDSKYPFIGFMDGLRITKDLARYTSSFTLPTSNFDNSDPDFSSVSLLIEFSGNNIIDSSNNGYPITNHGSIHISSENKNFNLTSGAFKEIGSILKIGIYNHGYGYDSLPTFLIKTKLGTGAVLTPMSNNIGQIESVEIIDPFVDLYETPNISISSMNGTGAVLTAISKPVYSEAPSWKSTEGMLGINCHLLDSYYYQQFSYLVYSPVPRKETDSIIDEWCHPAGFVRFAILDITLSNTEKPFLEGRDAGFYLTIIRNIAGYDNVYMVNPIYNLHWFKELSNSNYTNWVGGFDWIQEEWTNNANYYMSQGLDIYPITKYYLAKDPRLLFNQQSWLDWYKNSQDNYSYTIEIWDDITTGDPPLGTTDANYTSRKRVNDDTIIMTRALDSEIEVRSV